MVCRSSWCWADTGIEIVVPSGFVIGSEPAGRVRLLADRTPWIWLIETLLAASLAGSSLTTRRYWVAPLRSTLLTPSMPWSDGTMFVAARAFS